MRVVESRRLVLADNKIEGKATEAMAYRVVICVAVRPSKRSGVVTTAPRGLRWGQQTLLEETGGSRVGARTDDAF